MVIALWMVRVVVALVFFVVGGMKVMVRTRPGKKPGEAGAAIPLPMRLLGGAEVLGALGLILPVAASIAPVLTIAAAVCLGLVMVGASMLHLIHREEKELAVTLTLLVLAVFIVIGHLVWVPLV
jgi:putative oxidoreductase